MSLNPDAALWQNIFPSLTDEATRSVYVFKLSEPLAMSFDPNQQMALEKFWLVTNNSNLNHFW